MDLPPLNQATTATVELVELFGMDGSRQIAVIAKQRFLITPRGALERTAGARVLFTDEPWDPDAPARSSIKLPCDVCPRKPGADVVVVGAAVHPNGARGATLDVSVRVGTVGRALRVHGPRVWYRGALGLTLTPGEPFESVPLRWELAYGGSDFSDPRRPLEEPRNPLGRGVARDAASLVHQPGPQIEDAHEPINGARRHPAPAGVGPIGRHWEPRRRYAGTADEQWMRERMPLLPADFDERFYHCAPPELVAPAPLRGGEPVELIGLSPAGPMRFALPRMSLFVGARTDRGLVPYPVALDTVVLHPGERFVDLTFRALVPRTRELRAVQVHDREVLA